MKIITSILIFFIISFKSVQAESNNCEQFEKLSKEYATCNSKLIKKKSNEIKNKTVKKSNEIKNKTVKKSNDIKNKTVEKIKKFNLKKKLSLFKNSKSHKEFMEKMKNEN